MTADRWIRAAATAAVLVVAGIAAAISFGHIEHVALTHGQPLMAARALPVSVDGAVVASSLALLDAARRGVQAPALARIMLGAGVAATLAANAISGAGHGPVGIGVAVLPAAAFIGSVEVLLGMIRVQAVPEAANESATDGVPEASPARTRPAAPRALPRSRSRALGGHRAPEQIFAQELAAGTVPGVRAIKRQCRVGQIRAAEIRDQLAARLSEPRETVEVGG